MGLFLHTSIILNCEKGAALEAIEDFEETYDMDVITGDWCIKEHNNGVVVSLNNDCFKYDELGKEISLATKSPVMMLSIYDDDFWGYEFYKDGDVIDSFNSAPSDFKEIFEDENISHAGNSKLISEYFNISEESIKNYLIPWTDEMLENPKKAYADDRFEQHNCRQMADFMKKLGYPYE